MQSRRRAVRARIPGFAAGLTLSAACVLSAAGPAKAEVLRLDTDACRVAFTLDATLHEVEGLFTLQGGTIVFDPATGEASGRVVITAASGDTHNGKRDRKMHEKVLESSLYPEIVFVPERIVGTFLPMGDSEVSIEGAMEIHGARHAVAIPARVHVENGRLTGTAGLTIPYVAWGMKDPSFLIFRVAKEVVVSLELAGTVDAPAAALPPGERPAGRPAP